MDDLLAELTKIRDLTETLNPSAFRSKAREWRRGGLPRTSFSDGPRGSETPLMASDTFDRWLAMTEKTYAKHIIQAVNALETALRAQNGLLIKAPAVPDEPEFPCKNLACGNLHHRETAECDRCRQHRHRYGLTYPQMQETG